MSIRCARPRSQSEESPAVEVNSFALAEHMWERLRLMWLRATGSLANLLGWPCVVRPCEYTSRLASVSVRCGPLFTVVTVNGVNVYFYRLTGRIDGVGSRPPGD